MRTWKEVEKTYGIKIYLEDGSVRSVKEVLDDLYLKFTPAQASKIILNIMENGHYLFADVLEHKK
jgi:hypothetical protein